MRHMHTDYIRPGDRNNPLTVIIDELGFGIKLGGNRWTLHSGTNGDGIRTARQLAHDLRSWADEEDDRAHDRERSRSRS